MTRTVLAPEVIELVFLSDASLGETGLAACPTVGTKTAAISVAPQTGNGADVHPVGATPKTFL